MPYPRNTGLLVGMSGMAAGFAEAQSVSWPTLPKAALAMVVSATVSLMVLAWVRRGGARL